MTTALQRRIADEAEQERQRQWAERKEFGRVQRNPRWACDTLSRTGQISGEQYDAARRYISLLERAHVVTGGGYERTDGGDSDIHARLWDAAVCRQTANSARMFVLKSRSAIRTRMFVFDRLFSFPLPTMGQMQQSANGRYPHEFAVRRIGGVLDLLSLFFSDADQFYGR